MAKISLTDIASGYLSSTVINANNALIEAEFDNCLSRDGSSPNSMAADIDMDSNKITNLTDGTNNQDAVTLAQLTAAGSSLTSATAVTTAVSDAGAYYTGTNVEAVLQEVGASLAAAGGISDIVEDTSPQLGGDLDMNSNNITAAGPVSISPTEMSYLNGVSSNIQTQLNAKGVLNNVVEDTTPQLGGNLDTNSNNISGAGTLDMAPNARSVSSSTNTASTDYSKVINLTGGSGQTFTLDGDPPTNAIIFIDNAAGNSWTIAASTSLIWAKDGTTGNRTLADDGVAIAKHRGSGTWIISGSAKLT